MTCNCENHRVSNMAYTADTSLVLTLTDSTNISSLDDFNFFLPCNQNPSTIVTGEPVQVYAIINGTSYPIYNKYHLPLMSNYLKRRKLYQSWYVNDGTTGWLEFKTLPQCKCNA